jgi:ATP-dependent RNA helicase SUPV3L1/SUV3
LRLERWVRDRIAARLEPLLALGVAMEAKSGTASSLPGPARGIAHQLIENFGSLDRAALTLPDDIRPLLRALKIFGIWFGRRSIFLPKLLRPEAASLLAILWRVWNKLENLPTPPQPGLTSFANDANVPEQFLAAAGFRLVGRRAIRLDMLERLEEELEKGAANGAQAEILLPKLVSLLGCGNDELKDVLAQLGWRSVNVGEATTTVWRKRREHRKAPPAAMIAVRADSPFAELAALIRK